MIPLRDNVPSKRFPVITWILILINVLIFIYTISLRPETQEQLVFTFGMVPARLNLGELQDLIQQPGQMISLLTSQFLHANWFHLISNMWILFIFGDNVEDLMGKMRFILFYLLSGVAANFAHALALPNSQIPAVGASGAIAGVLGAYFLLFPHARVQTVLFVFIIPWFIQIPAVLYLGVWFILQISQGLIEVNQNVGGVAWWAHVGGFVFGLAAVHFFVRRNRLSSQYGR
ncbi:MAG: rhomboid family intramembrane serine protease [Anaerolineales bacterium]|nr:rhomboid family intramembrane serine protease [Anaerolineales bacterium]